MKKRFQLLGVVALMFALLCLQATPCAAQCTDTLPEVVLAVDAQSQAQSPDGRSWECAFPSLAQALAEAEASEGEFTEIWVAASATPYKPGSSATDSFVLVPGVAIYGGFVGNETTSHFEADPYTNITTLSGDLGKSVFAYHVVTAPQGATATTILDGFVITAGKANGSSGLQNKGGGLLIDASAQNSVSSPTIVRCRFIGNEAEFGGAVAIQRFTTSGTFASPRFTNCEFSANVADEDGGAIWCSRANALFVNSLFESNSATNGSGGAIATVFSMMAQTPLPLIQLYNCTISENTAGDVVGGVLVERNSALEARNSIFWANEDSNGFIESSQIGLGTSPTQVAVDYSCVQGLSSSWGTGNISNDPDLTGTFELNAGSPAINTADPGVANDDDNGYFPRDEFDLDNDGVTATSSPYEITPDIFTMVRVFAARLDMGSAEVVFINESCQSDCVDSAFNEPGDGEVGARTLVCS